MRNKKSENSSSRNSSFSSEEEDSVFDRPMNEDDVYIFTKGPPEAVIDLCSMHFNDKNQGTDTLTDLKKQELNEITKRM